MRRSESSWNVPKMIRTEGIFCSTKMPHNQASLAWPSLTVKSHISTIIMRESLACHIFCQYSKCWAWHFEVSKIAPTFLFLLLLWSTYWQGAIYQMPLWLLILYFSTIQEGRCRLLTHYTVIFHHIFILGWHFWPAGHCTVVHTKCT
jgi:hypothetical protein